MPDGLNISGQLTNLLSQMPSALAEDRTRQKREDELGEQAIAAQERAGAERQKITADYADKLKPPDLQKYVPPQPTGLAEQWGSPAMWLAALGSLLTRNHLTAALTAAGSVMNAYAQGDAKRADQAFKEWQINTDNAIKMHDYELETYKQLMSNAGLDTDTKLAMFQTYAAAHKNSALGQLTNAAGDLAQVEHYLNDMSEHGQKMKDAAEEAAIFHRTVMAQHALADAKQSGDKDRIDKATRDYNSMVDETKAWLTIKKPGGEAALEKIDIEKAGGGAMPETPEAREASAGQAATGEPLSQIIPGYGKDAVAARREIRDLAIKKIQKDTGMSATDAGAELARRSIEFQSGKTSVAKLNTMYGATKQAVDQLDFNIAKAEDEMKKLASTDLSPVFNSLIRGEQHWTGDPAYSSLFYYMQATATESARILAGGQASVAQLAEGARNEAQQWANVGMTPAAFHSVAEAMKLEGRNRLETFRDARDSQMPGAPADNYKSLDEVKKAYQDGKIDYDEAERVLRQRGWVDDAKH